MTADGQHNEIPYSIYHGLGNSFIMFDARIVSFHSLRVYCSLYGVLPEFVISRIVENLPSEPTVFLAENDHTCWNKVYPLQTSAVCHLTEHYGSLFIDESGVYRKYPPEQHPQQQMPPKTKRIVDGIMYALPNYHHTDPSFGPSVLYQLSLFPESVSNAFLEDCQQYLTKISCSKPSTANTSHGSRVSHAFDDDVHSQLSLYVQSLRIHGQHPTGEDSASVTMPPTPTSLAFHWTMLMNNRDGSQPEMCGNGIRALSHFIAENDAQLLARSSLSPIQSLVSGSDHMYPTFQYYFHTMAGVKRCIIEPLYKDPQVQDDDSSHNTLLLRPEQKIEVDMGIPAFGADDMFISPHYRHHATYCLSKSEAPRPNAVSGDNPGTETLSQERLLLSLPLQKREPTPSRVFLRVPFPLLQPHTRGLVDHSQLAEHLSAMFQSHFSISERGTTQTSFCIPDHVNGSGKSTMSQRKSIIHSLDEMKTIIQWIIAYPWEMSLVNTSVPHGIIFLSDADTEVPGVTYDESADCVTTWDLVKCIYPVLGEYFCLHEMFLKQSNIEFVRVLHDTTIRCPLSEKGLTVVTDTLLTSTQPELQSDYSKLYDALVYERGCGVTHACGTGACAVVVADMLTNDSVINNVIVKQSQAHHSASTAHIPASVHNHIATAVNAYHVQMVGGIMDIKWHYPVDTGSHSFHQLHHHSCLQLQSIITSPHVSHNANGSNELIETAAISLPQVIMTGPSAHIFTGILHLDCSD